VQLRLHSFGGSVCQEINIPRRLDALALFGDGESLVAETEALDFLGGREIGSADDNNNHNNNTKLC
jgi:hypothetical protein